MMKCILFAGLLVFALPGLSRAQQNPDKLELVKAGRLTEARADWWGFDEEDSTAFLQAAVDSGVRKLVVPNMGKPWIVNPIALASDQEMVLEPGTVIEAIEGGFKGKKDCLFSAKGKKNITIRGKDAVLRMRKRDYQDKAQYEPAEWRHGIGLLSCENVNILGLTIMSSGGDGVYVGSSGEPTDYCKDITIRDCVIDDNHRQGISVISVVNLLIENCVIKNTKGTPPQAGIDFEPNAKRQRLFGIVVKNCVFENNAYAGVIISSHPGPDTAPISIHFEDCRAIGSGFSGGFGPNPPLSKIDASMTNCSETVKGKTKIYNDFWRDFQNMQTLDKRKQEIVDRLKRVDVRGVTLKPLDEAAYKQAKETALPFLRGTSSSILYAREGDEVFFKASYRAVGRPKLRGMAVHIMAPSGGEVPTEGTMVSKEEEFSFAAEETGAYIITCDPGWSLGQIASAPPPAMTLAEMKPVAMLALDAPLHLFGRSGAGTFYFHVPVGVAEFYVQAGGAGSERVKVSVYDAAGDLFETQDQICVAHKFVVSRKDASRGEVWSLKTEQATGFYLEDFYIDLVGIPPILSPEKGSLLVPVQ